MTAEGSKTQQRRCEVLCLLALSVLVFLNFISFNSSNVKYDSHPVDTAFHNDETAAASAPANASITIPNASTVAFLAPRDFFDVGEMYSGMWWQNRNVFVSLGYDGVKNLESATLAVFSAHKSQEGRGVRLTRDWLDMSVEHLSKYVKHINWASNTKNELNFLRPRLEQILEEYIARVTPIQIKQEWAVQSTLALLPTRASGPQAKQLDVLQLAATVASLWRAGFGRALVVGVSEEEAIRANEAFGLLEQKLKQRPMELAYVQHMNATNEEKRVVPRLALKGLQRAMKNETSKEARAWLGTNPSRWQNVYFTEPDLILQTRSSALPALSQALQEGKLLVGHRLEPIPHARNFPADKAERVDQHVLLPDIGSFASIQRRGDNHSCCRQDINFFPANVKNPSLPEKSRKVGCPGIWSHCGFNRKGWNYNDPAIVLEAHVRLLGYPFFALEGVSAFRWSERVREFVSRWSDQSLVPKSNSDLDLPVYYTTTSLRLGFWSAASRMESKVLEIKHAFVTEVYAGAVILRRGIHSSWGRQG